MINLSHLPTLSPAVHTRSLALISLLLGGCCIAQDTRQVGRPQTPESCAVITAQLTPHHGILTNAEESNHRDNARIEHALATCPAGQAVVLRAGSNGMGVFLISPLTLPAQATLVVEAGAAVWGSRNPREYDVSLNSCGTANRLGCKPLILAEHAFHSSIMGDGVIDGRGGAPLLGSQQSWWALSFHAMTVTATVSVPALIALKSSDDFTLAGITLRNAPGTHVQVSQTNRFSTWDTKIDTPAWAHGTDGIDITAASNITIADASITTGGDDIQLHSGEAGSVSHATLRNVHLFHGHGLTIGGDSGEVSAIRVENLIVDGTDDGLRIRSIGGTASVSDVEVNGACMHGALNPIMITPLAAALDNPNAARYRDLTLRDVHVLTPGQLFIRGSDAEHTVDVRLDNVSMDGVKPDTTPAKFARITIGPRAGSLVPGGEGVFVDKGKSTSAVVYDCTDKFGQFPLNKDAPASVAPAAPTDKTIYLAPDGSAQYYSLEAALHQVPPTGAAVQMAPGIYRERAYITQSHVTLRSLDTDASKTVLVYDTGAGIAREEHSNLPVGGATLTVMGDDFHAENITIQNDYSRTHHQVEATSAAQALYLQSDRSIFRNVHILGYQDTLFIASRSGDRWCKDCIPARSYFTQCFISGSVDFIFGDAKAVFDSCEIRSMRKGYLTAQSKHYPEQESGYVFNHCKLTAEPGVEGVFLGRPWQSHATVVFLNTEMGAHILPVGWSEWNALHRLDTAFFAEYNSTGPGADVKDRTPKSHQLSAAEAAPYETRRFLAGSDHWDPNAR